MEEPTKPNVSKHAQIIEAAVAEFQENGFAAASMDRISTRASVSKRTLYKYFESKDNLFRSIIVELSNRFSGMLEIRYDPARDLRDQLSELAWAEGRVLLSPEVMAMSRMIISETLRNPELAQEAQCRLDKTASFVNMMRDADAAGKMHVEDADAAGQEFIGLIKSKAFWPMILSGAVVSKDEMATIVDSAVEMIMRRYATT